MYMPAKIQLKTVKMVEIGPESDVHREAGLGDRPGRVGETLRSVLLEVIFDPLAQHLGRALVDRLERACRGGHANGNLRRVECQRKTARTVAFSEGVRCAE